MSRIRADRYTNREGTGAPTFSEGVNVVGVTSMSGDFVLTNGIIAGPSQLTISGITSSIVGITTVTDVFVYDTSKDSDGGAWRKKTQDTSWYNETLNTATRGSRKDFPAVAVIVGEINKVTIYDGDDPDLPMWMIFNKPSNGYTDAIAFGKNLRAIYQLNGKLAVATNDGQALIDFISEDCRTLRADTQSNKNAAMYGGIVNRNGNMVPNTNAFDSAYNIGDSSSCNDVAMTLLPNAPIDDATGLPVPTIAVATNGGTSVIRDNGTVVDLNVVNRPYSSVYFSPDNLVWAVENPAGVGYDLLRYFEIPSADITTASSYGPSSTPPLFPSNTTGNFFYNFAYGSPLGLSILDHADGTGSATSGMIAYVTADYDTGWMQGDIQLVTLSDTDATNQTGGTVPDRSASNTSVNVLGTITRTAVATGADLVAYSGFSANNVLVQPYNANLNPGTGDYSFTFWFKCSATTAEQQYMRRFGVPTTTGGMMMRLVASTSVLQWYVRDTSSSVATVQSTTTVDDDVWHFAVGTRQGSVANLYIDGVLVNTSTCSANSHDPGTTADLVIGAEEVAASPGTYQNPADLSSMALVRYSLSVPSAEQVKKMYDDEKHLFQENSKATLYGSSNAVTALAYDDTTNILHVGSSDGRSDFQGLRRINNTTVGITSAISASNELVAEQ